MNHATRFAAWISGILLALGLLVAAPSVATADSASCAEADNGTSGPAAASLTLRLRPGQAVGILCREGSRYSGQEVRLQVKIEFSNGPRWITMFQATSARNGRVSFPVFLNPTPRPRYYRLAYRGDAVTEPSSSATFVIL